MRATGRTAPPEVRTAPLEVHAAPPEVQAIPPQVQPEHEANMDNAPPEVHAALEAVDDAPPGFQAAPEDIVDEAPLQVHPEVIEFTQPEGMDLTQPDEIEAEIRASVESLNDFTSFMITGEMRRLSREAKGKQKMELRSMRRKSTSQNIEAAAPTTTPSQPLGMPASSVKVDSALRKPFQRPRNI